MRLFDCITIILFIYLIYSVNFRVYENMASSPNVEKAINKVYKADLESMRNLAEISKKLQKGELTVPGDLRVKGKLKVDDDLITKGNGIIGNAYIGKWKTSNGTYAAFCHKNRMKSSNYSILSKNSGRTYLSTDGVLPVRKNNGNGVKLDVQGSTTIKGNTEVKGNTTIRNKFYCHGVSYFKNQKKNVWSHINWKNGKVYLRGNVRIDGSGGSGSNLYVKDDINIGGHSVKKHKHTVHLIGDGRRAWTLNRGWGSWK